jgi:hypothetical protein
MMPIFVRLLLVVALSSAALPAAGEQKMEPSEKSVVIDAAFGVLMPAGWEIGWRAGGVVFTGPAAEGVSALISVRYVSPDDSMYGTPEEYMNRLTRPSSIPLKGWKNGQVEKVTAADRAALRLERDTTQTTSPHTLEAKGVSLREEHLAVSAAQGFYMLIYTAPRSIDKEQRPVFRSLIESFEPKF